MARCFFEEESNKMKLITLNANSREVTSQGDLNTLRASDSIPAVIYGKGAEPVLCSVKQTEFRDVYGPGRRNNLLNVVVGGSEYSVIVYDVQKDVITQQIVHLDFKLVREDETIKVYVPVHLEGVPVGVRTQGGAFMQQTKVIRISCLPAEIPANFSIDINEYEAGFSYYVRNIDLKGARLESSDRAVLFTIKSGRGVAK